VLSSSDISSLEKTTDTSRFPQLVVEFHEELAVSRLATGTVTVGM